MSKHSVKACLIVNPRSGGGRVDLSEALMVLESNRWEVHVRRKLHKGYAEKLAKEAADGCYFANDRARPPPKPTGRKR